MEPSGSRAAAARLPPHSNKLSSEWNKCQVSIADVRLPGKRTQRNGSLCLRTAGWCCTFADHMTPQEVFVNCDDIREFIHDDYIHTCSFHGL